MAKMRKEKREEIFREAIKRWQCAYDAEERQRELMNEDTLFAQSQDGQWVDLVNGDGGTYTNGASNQSDNRARFTVNKIAASLAVVYGNYIHIRPQSKLLAAGLGADKKSAEIRTGLVRGIEQQNQASDIYDTAFKNQIQCGFGAWKIKTDYSDDDTFDQDIIMSPIPDAANTVWFDPVAEKYDRRDGTYAFHVKHIDIEDYKRSWPKSGMSKFPTMSKLASSGAVNSFWYNGNTVAVGQYWRKVPVKKKIGLLETGETVEVTKELELSLQNGEGAELVRDEMGKIKTRMVDSHRVEMFMMNGMEILTDPYVFPSKFIPIVPAYGEQVVVQGERHIRGMVRFAKDPQRINNYANSAFVESVAITPEQPYIIASEQIDGFEDEWEAAGAELPPYLRYNNVAGVNMPVRAQAPQANQALLAQMAQSESDIRAAMGVINAGGMERPQEISGKSFREQIKNNDLGTVIFTDNLKKSVQYSTEIINDLLGSVYDSERVSRIIGDDGTQEEIVFNQAEFDDRGEKVILNDLSAGKYEVQSSTAPSYASQKAELMETMTAFTRDNPALQMLSSDLVAGLIEAPFADELKSRVRKTMIDSGQVIPTEDEVEEFGINPQAIEQQKQATEQANQAFLMQEANKAQAETSKLQEEAANKAAATDKLVSDNQSTLIDNINKALANIKLKQEMGIPVTEQDLILAAGTQEIAIDDLADSVQERSELEQMMVQQLESQQAQQQAQAVAPIQPNAEQQVMIQQQKDMM